MQRDHEHAKEHTVHQASCTRSTRGTNGWHGTFSGRQVCKTTFQTLRFHSCPDGISTEQPDYRNKFCVLYTTGCSCEFHLLLHITYTQQTLNKLYVCKFNIKVIIDYFLTLLSLTWAPQLSRNVAADSFGRDTQEFLYKNPGLKMRMDPTIRSFLFFHDIWE